MSKADDIKSKLLSNVAVMRAELGTLTDCESVAAEAIEELGGYPKAGIKVVNSEYRPWHRRSEFEYKPGNTLTADDWVCESRCGRGLHYSPTIADALSYVSTHYSDERAVIVVSTKSHISIDSTKSKAKTLYVDREIKLDDISKRAKIEDTIKQTLRAIEQYDSAVAAYREFRQNAR